MKSNFLKQLCLFTIFCFLGISSFCQDLSTKQKNVINKWIHAVINIQCTPEVTKEYDVVSNQLSKHQINYDQYLRKLDSINFLALQLSSSGTAIYLLYKKHHYLITARHVLNDFAKDTSAIFYKIFLINDINNPGNTKVVDRFNNMSGEREPFLMMYQYYIFSPLSDDIGIVCLDGETEGIDFWKTLDKRGYIPINIEDIDEKCRIKVDEKMICIGYPQESVIGNKIGKLPISAFLWQSFDISSPLVTKGSISNILNNKNYFYGDIFVYHGFSGGPAILNNKLVGLISGAGIEPYTSNSFTYRLFNFKFMKSSLIVPLLKKIEFGMFKD